MSTPEKRLLYWRTIANGAWAVIGIIVLLAAAGWLLGQISAALAPFVVAFIFVFALQIPVGRLAERGVSRGLATGIWFLAALVIISIALVFIVPAIAKQVVEIANDAPNWVRVGSDWFVEAQNRANEILIPNWLKQAALSGAQSASGVVIRFGNSVAEGVITAGSGIATVIIDLALGVVIAFWTLKDLPKIREELKALVGEKYEDDFENLLTTVGRMAGGYLKGQTIVSLITGVLAGIGLALIGFNYALVLAVIVTIFNFVPYIGPFVAGLIAVVLGLFQSPLIALGALLVIIAAQNLTDTFITPRVMGEHVDLHPTLVIFSLLVGGALFGFWGMVLAIPVAATVKALFVYYYERRTKRTLASEDGALFRTPTDDGRCEPDENGETDSGEHACADETEPTQEDQ